MRVELLGQLGVSASKLPKYRVVERVVLLWSEGSAAEHAILLYNNHKPNSGQRFF